jgi:hypothetical protein
MEHTTLLETMVPTRLSKTTQENLAAVVQDSCRKDDAVTALPCNFLGKGDINLKHNNLRKNFGFATLLAFLK